MPYQLVDRVPDASVPNDGRFIEGASEDKVAVRVEMQRNQLTFMAFKCRVDFAHLDVPELG